jgi:hypothetical protein
MENLSVFDKLVDELSRDERRKLLAQIEDTVVLSAEPLNAEAEQEMEAGADSELAFQTLSSFARFLFKLKGLFAGKTGLEAYEESLLARIRKDLTKLAPQFADYRHHIFLEPMKAGLEGLRASAEFFLPYRLPPAERVRSEFIAFLARRRVEPLMKRLEDETDPRTIVAEKEIATEADIKSEMERRFHAIIETLPEEEREALYLDCQALDCLKAFCDVDFESILGRFAPNRSRGGYACSFGENAKRLLGLIDVLKGARLPPSKAALQALFLYVRQKELKGERELEDFLQHEFGEAENALARIRAFNHDVPLGLLAKLLAGDCNYRPAGVSGGEDWFVLFKKYWAARLAAIFRNYVHTLRTTSVIDKAYAVLGVRRFEEIRNYHPSFYDAALTVTHWRSLSFILAFFKNVFTPKILRSLKILLLNGEFYKTENRIAFADVFNFLSTLNEKLLVFEKRLEATGEIGKAMADVRAEKTAPAFQAKKLEPLLKKADAEALSLTQRTIEALKTLNKVLNGILYSEAGGAFDTLSNLGYIGGKENESLKKEWIKVISLSYEVFTVLLELVTVESPS